VATTPQNRFHRPDPRKLVQVLILGLLTLTLAEPNFDTADIDSHTIILLDGSKTMHATNATTTRFDTAMDRLEAALSRWRRGASDNSRVSVLLAGPVPEVLIARSAAPQRSIQHLASARPGGGRADWERTLALAEELNGGAQVSYMAITDDVGALALRNVLERLENDPAVSIEVVGDAASNRGLENLKLEYVSEAEYRLTGAVVSHTVEGNTPDTNAVLQVWVDPEIAGVPLIWQQVNLPLSGGRG